MKLPRDLSGSEIVRLLERPYGHLVVETEGSHMTLESTIGGSINDVTAPRHRKFSTPFTGSVRISVTLASTYKKHNNELVPKKWTSC